MEMLSYASDQTSSLEDLGTTTISPDYSEAVRGLENLYFLSDALNDIEGTRALKVLSSRKTPPRASTGALGGVEPWTGSDWICGVQPGSVGSEVSQIVPSETSDGAGHDKSRVHDVSRVRPTVPFFLLPLARLR